MNYRKSLFVIFTLAEIILYTCFLSIDITGNGSYTISNYLKFTGIILCLLFTLFYPYRKEDRMDAGILRMALLFTVISDLLILILDYYTIGLITFCVVQSLYLIRLGNWRSQLTLTGVKTRAIKGFLRNLFVSILIITVLFLFQIELEWLILISVFYFVSIVFNVIDSIIIAYGSKLPNRIIFAIGMVLFLLCDINVGLFNLSDFISVHSRWFTALFNFSTVAMWMFYLPAQVVISLSGQSNYKAGVKV